MVHKIVVTVDLSCDKHKQEVFNVVSGLEGVNKMEASDGHTLTVIGEADPYAIIACLRKAGKNAHFVSIGPPPKPEEKKPECKCKGCYCTCKHEWSTCQGGWCYCKAESPKCTCPTSYEGYWSYYCKPESSKCTCPTSYEGYWCYCKPESPKCTCPTSYHGCC